MNLLSETVGDELPFEWWLSPDPFVSLCLNKIISGGLGSLYLSYQLLEGLRQEDGELRLAWATE